MKIKYSMLCMVMCSVFAVQAGDPHLEHVMDLDVSVSEAFTVGDTPHGRRVVVPITGGTFEGRDLRGEVLPGGADYQLVDTVDGRTELEAIYCIRTDDGHAIHVRNNGIVSTVDGKGYFFTTPRFEAPRDSRYGYLNDAVFVCRPVVFRDGGIVLRVWMVTD